MVPVWLGLSIVAFAVKNLSLPDIVLNGSGFMDAVRKGLGYLRTEWRQTGMFLLVKILLGVVVAAISGFGVLAGALVIGIPLTIAGILLSMVHPVLVVIPAFLGVVGIIAVVFLVSIHLRTFMYRWVLNVYAGIDSS